MTDRQQSVSALIRRHRWRPAASWAAMPCWISKRRAALCFHGRGLSYDLEEGAPYSSVFDVARRLGCKVFEKWWERRGYRQVQAGSVSLTAKPFGGNA